MNSNTLGHAIIAWLNSIKHNNTAINIWTSAQDMYKLFITCSSSSQIDDITYQTFLKKLNVIVSHTDYLTSKVLKDDNYVRMYYYFINYDINSNTESNDTTLSPTIQRARKKNNRTLLQQDVSHNQSSLIVDASSLVVTPTDNRHNGNNSTIRNISEMSISNSETLPRYNMNTHVLLDPSLAVHNLDIPVLSDNNRSNTKYPTLTKYGITTDLSTQEGISNIHSLLIDIEKLSLEYDLTFPRINNTFAKPYFIPTGLSSMQAYNNWEKKGYGIINMLVNISNKRYDIETNEPIAISYLLKRLSKVYPKSFETQAINIGYTRPPRMSAIETAAVLSESGIADRKIYDVIQKHIKCKLNGHELFCPKRDLDELTSRLPKVECKSIQFERELDLKKEKVELAIVDTNEAICLDMDRYLVATFDKKEIFDDTTSPYVPLYKTKTPATQDGTYVLIGTDHGKGAAQFLIRFLLGGSDVRRRHNRPDYNTRTISYATIKCRKDPYEILKLSAEETNKCIATLSTHNLVSLCDEQGTMRCIFIDARCTSYTVTNRILYATGPNIDKQYQIPIEIENDIKYRIVCKSFYVLQVGDLAAQMALQGRESMASTRCIKCSLTKAEWTNEMSGRDLTIADINNNIKPNANIGQKQCLLWNICPSNTVVPILHCEMGTVNDQLYKKLFRDILTLDVGSNEEYNKRMSVIDIRETMEQLEETKDSMETDLDMLKHNLSSRRNELNRTKVNAQNRLKNAKRNSVLNAIKIGSLEDLLTITRRDIKEIDTILYRKKEEVDSLEKEIVDQFNLLDKAELSVKSMQWESRRQEVSIHSKIERILESHGVTIQTYHGGNLTGGAILTFLEKHQSIMDDIKDVCKQYIDQHIREGSSLSLPTIEVFNLKLDAHRRLFKAQDAVYAHLRLIHPTRQEMIETRERIAIMKSLWLSMGLSVTPKAHLIFTHAADDQQRYGGIGDKIEDPLEKRHQFQMQVDLILNRMKGGLETKMHTQLKYEWRNTHPLVIEQIKHVSSRTRRKRKLPDDVSIADERRTTLITERHRMRAANINDMNLTQM